MRLVFCGTPQFAVPTLNALAAAGHTLELAISQPDRPVGRAGEVHRTPVRQTAEALGIPVLQPEKIRNNDELRATLTAIAPDAIIVVAYGRIIPQWMLDLPRHGCINGHASLLPRWRGAAPIQWAIASGDSVTGVTTMRLDAGLDTGPMLLKENVPIGEHTTSPQLFTSLAEVGAQLMLRTLAALEEGTLQPEAQQELEASPAPILQRDDGRIDFNRSAREVDQRFRGFQPWPGAFTTLRGRKLIVHAMSIAEGPASTEAGTLNIADGSIIAACGNGSAVRLEEVQMEGKKRMSAEDFLRGFQIKTGERVGG